MNKIIILLITALFIGQSSFAVTAKDYKPVHGGYSGELPVRLTDIPDDLKIHFLQFLEDAELKRAMLTCRSLGRCTAAAKREQELRIAEEIEQRKAAIIAEFLAELVDIPEVTVEDVADLNAALAVRHETTQITPKPAFRAALTKTSNGLYWAVMGQYPEFPFGENFNRAQRDEIIASWRHNPDLPLTFTTSAEDVAFAAELSRITGRRFRVMSDAENEYTIRGRDAAGAITSTVYFFGDVEAERPNHGWFRANSENRVHGVHEGDFSNSFGLRHPIGNVYSRSENGVMRGGSFRSYEWAAESSERNGGYEEIRGRGIGSRLAEDL